MEKLLPQLAAASSDPRAKWTERVSAIVDRECRNLPPDMRSAFIGPLLAALDQELAELFEQARLVDGAIAIGRFETKLRALVTRAFETDARLRPSTPASEIVAHRLEFEQLSYAGIELDVIKTLLHPGERIARVELRRVTTDRGTIERASLPIMSMPTTTTRFEKWASQFPSPSLLDELELSLALPSSPQPPWSGNRNVDIR